jgi:SAM-dependent methyltransferase
MTPATITPAGTIPSSGIAIGGNPRGTIPGGTIPGGTIPGGAIPGGTIEIDAIPIGTIASGTPAATMLAVRDRYLAPSLLAPFAYDMACRLSRMSMGPLLEICADVGCLTAAMASSMSAGLTMIATDPSAETVAFASGKPGTARITWQRADPAILPFPDAAFGVVTCHFAVAAMPDPVQAFLEARRVMKPGARFAFSVPGPIRHNPVAGCLQDAMEDLFPAGPPRFMRHILHGYADTNAIDDDLTAAGFTDAMYSVVDLPYFAASARDAALGYCLGTPLRAEIEARAPGEAEPVIRAVTATLEARFGSGPIRANMRACFVSAAG